MAAHLLSAKETVLDVTVGREPEAIARPAEMVAHGSDEADLRTWLCLRICACVTYVRVVMWGTM
jgi:hypothetical protein